MQTTKQLVEKWEGLLNADGVPEIANMNTKSIMARILENQQVDISSNAVYQDREITQMAEGLISEAVLAGDQGPSATDMAAGKNSGNAVGVGASVMGMVRRALPNLVAFDLCGVQPMSGPTTQLFALRAFYGAGTTGPEAFHPTAVPNANWSGVGATTAGKAIADYTASKAYAVGDLFKIEPVDKSEGVRFYQVSGAFTSTGFADLTAAHAEIVAIVDRSTAITDAEVVETAEAMATSLAEAQEGFNGTTGNAWNEMSFRIDKQTVAAKSRQLKAQYSIELAQDLRAVHGMDADTELNSILSNEIVVEINREIIDLINSQAQWGCSGKTAGTTKAGVFDLTDANDVKDARWAGEAYKSILIQIEKECNEIARQTGRGAGNVMIASRNVVSALAMTDTFVSFGAQGLQNGSLVTDTTKTVFAGVLGGRIKVFIDQYAVSDYITIGYKGANALDAGVFYLPYVPLTPLRAADSRNFQPVIGFKTRYGVGVNPFADPSTSVSDQVTSMDPSATLGRNGYFRKFMVAGL